MAKIIKVVYLDDQQDMRDGLKSFFETAPDFDVKFVGDNNMIEGGILNLQLFESEIASHKSDAVIVDNDIGGKQYDLDIVGIIKNMRTKEKRQIVLVGCSAYADASGFEPEMKKKGFDRFFDNIGSDDHLCIICDYIRKQMS